MKNWSNKWKSSKQKKKQRKYRYNAPLHVRHKFLSAHLSEELRKKYGSRSVPLRKGDEVEIMRGSGRGLRGTVERVDLKKCKVYVTGIVTKKVDGSEVMKPIQPSNLKILSLNLDDKRRVKSLMHFEGNIKSEAMKKKVNKDETKIEKKGSKG